jgi:superoxide dismutase
MKHLNTILFCLLQTIAFSQQHTLPNLRFAYAEYEPFIDMKTMEIHHTKHHQGYVTNLNKAITGTPYENKPLTKVLLNISNASDVIRNNAGGHYNHTLFWEILTPKTSSQPSELLQKAIEETFGKLDSLKTKMHQACMSRFGSGWAWLIVNEEGKLQVTSTANQDNPLMDIMAERGIPILGIDVWEHAYYLKHQNKRNDYIYAIWSILDWDVISQKYEQALKDPILAGIKSDNWPELKTFHKVMSNTFHAAEKKDFKPIIDRHLELMVKAYLLKNSEIPVLNLNDRPRLIKSLTKLEKQTKELDEFINLNKKVTNELIMKKLIAIHDSFHEVIGLCKEE